MMMAGVASVISRSSQPRALQIALGISLIVTVLVYFKLGYRIDGQRTTDELLIPLGLSYYALRVIHLILERYMGRITVLNSDELARYLLFLPTLQVGPIHRYGQFKRDIQRHRWVASDVYAGLERIIFGYAKIAVIGNFLISGLFDDYINTSNLPTLACFITWTVSVMAPIFMSSFRGIRISLSASRCCWVITSWRILITPF